MIFKNKLVIPSLLIMAVFSCSPLGVSKGCKKIDLSNDEQDWFRIIENYKTIYFSNSKNEIDTFLLTTKEMLSYTTCNTFELGPNVYQIGGYTYQSLDHYPASEYNDRLSVSFDKTGQDSTELHSKKQFYFFDLATGYFFDFTKIPKMDSLVPRLNKNITVYIFTKDENCSNQEGGTEIMQEFAISKEYGLIWYKTLKGDTYNRVW